MISWSITLGSQRWIHYKQPNPKPMEDNGKNYWLWQVLCQAKTKAQLWRRLSLVLQSASQTVSVWAQHIAPGWGWFTERSGSDPHLIQAHGTWRNFFKVSVDATNGKSEWSQTLGYFWTEIWKTEMIHQSARLPDSDYSLLVFPSLLFICCGIRYCR